MRSFDCWMRSLNSWAGSLPGAGGTGTCEAASGTRPTAAQLAAGQPIAQRLRSQSAVLTSEAAAKFPDTRYHVAQTLGIDDLILDLLDKRVRWCVDNKYACDACRATMAGGDAGPSRSPSTGRERAYFPVGS